LIVLLAMLFSCNLEKKLVTTTGKNESIGFNEYILINGKTVEILFFLNKDFHLTYDKDTSHCGDYKLENLHVNYQKDTNNIHVYFDWVELRTCNTKTYETKTISARWNDYHNFNESTIEIVFDLVLPDHKETSRKYRCLYKESNNKIVTIEPFFERAVDLGS